ncbi:hypothetical protein GSI_07890 [Ganoderma sinense ZZ0214-1]|uniref:Uncharacterized protein n=1 Tax=Ganoderma sinense ZZ0214-1 TaxID=1077348 RepID=A0A2G8S875_9APHY|nr:hypothetical protein GSI_07890 [Ganoderma sinense ZZ0214-1]
MAQLQEAINHNLSIQFSEALRLMVVEANKRIIEDVTYGPHSNISDPVIREIWEQMVCFHGLDYSEIISINMTSLRQHWHGGVGGLEFVFALRDHFRAKLDANPDQPSNDQDSDAWTLKYLGITGVQGIIEAIDDEAISSGYITVAKINAFTDSCLSCVGLLIGLLVSGYQMSMSRYVTKIDSLLSKMFALNATLTAAFRRPSVVIDNALLRRFEDYARADENRLLEKLEEMEYRIPLEQWQVVSDICGHGPIETHVFPLLYLLLKRDFEIMRLARKKCLHSDELKDSMHTIMSVFTAINERHQNLAVVLQFKFLQDPDEMWSQKELEQAIYLKAPYNDAAEAQDIDASNIIKYPLRITDDPIAGLTVQETYLEATQADTLLQKILGRWSGFCGEANVYPSQPMISLDLHADSQAKSKSFQSKGLAPDGSDWKLTGEYALSDNGQVHYTFSIAYVNDTQHFTGQLDESGTTLSGSWRRSGHVAFSFLFKRLSPDLMRVYPTPTELAANRPRALWLFAFSVIKDRRSRKKTSWKWFQTRWKTGQQYARLVMRSRETSPFTAEEANDLAKCHRDMTPKEARVFNIFIEGRTVQSVRMLRYPGQPHSVRLLQDGRLGQLVRQEAMPGMAGCPAQ